MTCFVEVNLHGYGVYSVLPAMSGARLTAVAPYAD